MKETGLVVGIDERNAKVKIERKSACGSCKGCRLGETGEMSMTIDVSNEAGARVGDLVEIDMETTDVLFAAFIMYGIPLIALLAGVFLSYGISPRFGWGEDWVHMLVGLVFTALSFLVIKTQERSIKQSTKFKPSVSRIMGKSIL